MNYIIANGMIRDICTPGPIIGTPQMEITYMPRQTLVGGPKTSMTIVAAMDDGWMVVDNHYGQQPQPKPSVLYPTQQFPQTVFAGTLQQCADYVVREMSPDGTQVDA